MGRRRVTEDMTVGSIGRRVSRESKYVQWAQFTKDYLMR